jgi:hypothetical protein
MPSPNLTDQLHQDCLGHLQKVLDMTLHTAEAASVEGNHKIVLQAVREVTRIITLMNKMTCRTDREVKPASPKDSRPTKTLPSQILNQQLDPSPDPESDLLQGILQDMFRPQGTRPTTASREPVSPEAKKKPSLSRPRAWLKNLCASQGPSLNAVGVGEMQPGSGR